MQVHEVEDVQFLGNILNVHLKFTVYGHKHSRSVVYTHTSAQCSPTSVGLAQARPNHEFVVVYIVTSAQYK